MRRFRRSATLPGGSADRSNERTTEPQKWQLEKIARKSPRASFSLVRISIAADESPRKPAVRGPFQRYPALFRSLLAEKD
jgi:hypothetical protein